MASDMENVEVASADSIVPAEIEKVRTTNSNAPDFERPVTGLRWLLVCLGLYLSAVLYGLDTTIAADVQGPILESLGEIEKLSWVGVGFPLGSVATILLIGICYGLFEIKWLSLSSIALFEIGSAICGAAPTMDTMIAGRVIAGVGGAGMYLGALNYVSNFTTLKERPIYMALIGLSWGTGCILGPVIGGAFADSSATWRWAFYINLVLAVFLGPACVFGFPKFQPRPELSTWFKLASIDWLGATLVAACFTLFIVVLSYSGVAWAWSSGGVIALWVVLGVLLVSFTLQQKFALFTTKENRIYPVQFLRSRTMLLLYVGTACSATSLFVPIYYVPIFFQFTKNDSAIEAAVRLLPFIIINIFFTMLAGALLPVIGYYMPLYLVSGAFMLIGGSLMYTVTSTTGVASIYGFEILIAIGAGIASQSAYSIVATQVKKHEIPAAIGFINVAQIGTIAIAGGIAGSIFQNTGFANLQHALAGQGFSEGDLRSALAGAQSAILSSAPVDVRQAAVDSIVQTIARLFALVIGAGALSLVASLAMKREKFVMERAAVVAA